MTEFKLPPTFDSPTLVLVEGSDDEALVGALVKHHGLPGFQLLNMKGKDDWTNKIRAISADSSFRANVLALGLVRDADQDPAAAWQSCSGAIRTAGLVAGLRPGEFGTGRPRTCVVIIPGADRKGAIEELCIDSFPPKAMTCVYSYFECLDGGQPSDRKSKAYVQAYLAGIIPLQRNLQVAASAMKLDLGHHAFDDLRAFLKALNAASTSGAP